MTFIATSDDASDVAEMFNYYREFYEQASNKELALEFITERLQRNESVIFLTRAHRFYSTLSKLFISFGATHFGVK